MSRSFSFYPTYVNTRWEQFTFTAPSCFLSCKLHFFYLITNKTLSTHGHRQCTRRIIIACLVISRSRAKEAEKEILRDRKRPTLKPHERKTRGTLGNLAANVLSRARARKNRVARSGGVSRDMLKSLVCCLRAAREIIIAEARRKTHTHARTCARIRKYR